MDSEAQLLPSRVTLEVTECEPVTDWAIAREVTQALRRLGVATVLDDFGTGHSGLRTLQQLSFDGLKVDRSFITQAVTGPCPKRYFAAMVELGLRLDLQVTAEGIETEEEAGIAGVLGCAVGQGFLYGAAMPGQVAQSMLAERPSV